MIVYLDDRSSSTIILNRAHCLHEIVFSLRILRISFGNGTIKRKKMHCTRLIKIPVAQHVFVCTTDILNPPANSSEFKDSLASLSYRTF